MWPSGWPAAATGARAAWSCTTTAPGGQCVMTAGTCMTPRWCAGSCRVAGRCRPPAGHVSAEAWAPLPWTTWSVWGQRPRCGNAYTVAGSPTTAATTKMLASSAQVGLIPTQAGGRNGVPNCTQSRGDPNVTVSPASDTRMLLQGFLPPTTHTLLSPILSFTWTLLLSFS